ncbi:ATP-binding protein [Deferribacter autotrophicus]|uniref:ATP-binding protein n=1 Tax=Deferribacter autotrophicus TaxID=500465 RepID=A0A5A8F2R8_9BACT|nr:ATP-binding protein [Deferribacter autotrophicus]KAA0257789.1 ATP-binding protein [Deferribacter autotrophicus]
MIRRKVSDRVLELSKLFPVITITGPRQSGKTTLCKMLFPDKRYVSLEDLDERKFAEEDPKGFLNRFPDGAVIDEIQYVPGLFSYIQTIVDEKNISGMYILTGSQQFEMLEHISQSLAGRVAIVKLLPFSLDEAYSNLDNKELDEVLFTGFFPRIFDKKINPTDMASFYVSTYLERDVRKLVNVKDLLKFEMFLKLIAARSGQLLNLSSIAEACGVSHNTIKSWVSVLEASYIIKISYPFFRNIKKRLVKTPKVYFLDTGLLCYLLGIRRVEHLEIHPLKGAIFESFVVAELLKNRFNKVEQDNLFFYRDHKGIEIDVVIDNGIELDLMEIKLSQTFSESFFKNFSKFPSYDYLTKDIIVYGGETFKYKNYLLYSWKDISQL